MSYRSGRRRVIAWSIILALALCALIWGLANGPGFTGAFPTETTSQL